jgi:aminopeptidase Y
MYTLQPLISFQQIKKNIVNMKHLLSLITLSVAARASVVQRPLHDAPSSQALIKNKPLVSSDALESHITSENLLKRAKKLFQIAELGAADYKHPTRVIGSAGRSQHLLFT